MSKADRVLLIILDGFGISSRREHNAIALANKPNLDRIIASSPHSELNASGTAVGLPDGVMGNSEVGHLNIGGGRIIKQELTKIADFARERGFESLPDVRRVLCEKSGSLHLMGLLSDGGVHSHQEHLFQLLDAAARVKCSRSIFVHVITDGRDTPPKSALQFVKDLNTALAKTNLAKAATVVGRYYIMDRDKRWERTELAYKALTGENDLPIFDSALSAVEDAYKNGETDEFIKPRLVKGGSRIKNGDSVLFFNFRADRARQISRAIALSDFNEFSTPVKISPKEYVTFTRYDESFPFPVLFTPSHYQNILPELVAAHGEKQLRIAETEKYAHVTYFFNGGEESVYKDEERILVQSPKDVPTYDLKPEMSAEKVTDELLKKMESSDYKLIVLNFANSDMVGHTGNESAAVKCIEVVDKCIGRITDLAKKKNYDVLITADHGNAECMVDPQTGVPHTAHTTNPVPLIWIPVYPTKAKLEDGILADIAPTILDLFGWPKPPEMTGHSLIIG